MVLFNKISVMDEEDGLIDLEEFSFSMNLRDHSVMSISLFKALDTNKVGLSRTRASTSASFCWART